MSGDERERARASERANERTRKRGERERGGRRGKSDGATTRLGRERGSDRGRAEAGWRRQRRTRRVETYICIGKCVPTPASHSRALPLPTGPLSLLAVYPPLCHPVHPRALRVPHRSFAPLVPTRDAHSRRSHDPTISLPTALALARAIPLSPTACLRSSFALFFPSSYLLFFSSSTPPGRRVIFIICYLLRHTPHRPSLPLLPPTAVCPARPTRKNRKIEENKSGRRGAPRIPRGGRARTAVAVTGGGTGIRTGGGR